MIKKVDDKMNKKGFTLIELLGVMVVLVIIFGLAVTGSIFPINTGKLGVYNAHKSSLETAAYNYLIDNFNEVSLKNEEKINISMQTLVNNGYIDSGAIKDPENGNCDSSYVIVTRTSETDEFDFNYKACLICKDGDKITYKSDDECQEDIETSEMSSPTFEIYENTRIISNLKEKVEFTGSTTYNFQVKDITDSKNGIKKIRYSFEKKGQQEIYTDVSTNNTSFDIEKIIDETGVWKLIVEVTNNLNVVTRKTYEIELIQHEEEPSLELYIISYTLNGGILASSNPTNYSIESNEITLNNPSKTGFIFDGWTGSNGNTPSTIVTIPTGSTGNRNYIANFTVDAIINPSITATSSTINVGSTTATTVSIERGTEDTSRRTYSSSNTSIATVDASGVVTGVAVGTATITVTLYDYEGNTSTATVSITVKVPGISATDMKNSASTYGLQNQAGAYRFVGANPNNYVWFNNQQWRIIGVYGDKFKIIKVKESATGKKWHSSNDSTAWSSSSIKTYLYNTYWGSLSTAAQNMVEQSATWYIGKANDEDTASQSYTKAKKTTWTGKVGLVASYEYMYAATSDCWSKAGSSFCTYNSTNGISGCCAKDWLVNCLTSDVSGSAWLINHTESTGAQEILRGRIFDGSKTNNANATPVVYLKSTILITGGNGKTGSTNSYKLSAG